MRTTLTIDDDLAAILQKRVAEGDRSLKEVVNSALRAGFAASGEVSVHRKTVKVQARALGLRAGFDPDKLNQLVDELEVGEFLGKVTKRGSSRH